MLQSKFFPPVPLNQSSRHSWYIISATLSDCAYSVMMESYWLSFYRCTTTLGKTLKLLTKCQWKHRKRKKLVFQFYFVLTHILEIVFCQEEGVTRQGVIHSFFFSIHFQLLAFSPHSGEMMNDADTGSLSLSSQLNFPGQNLLCHPLWLIFGTSHVRGSEWCCFHPAVVDICFKGGRLHTHTPQESLVCNGAEPKYGEDKSETINTVCVAHSTPI